MSRDKTTYRDTPRDTLLTPSHFVLFLSLFYFVTLSRLFSLHPLCAGLSARKALKISSERFQGVRTPENVTT